MINELSLTPFNKLNCMGMLNTLLPPQSPGNPRLPTPLLTYQTLKKERDGFFEYIRLVQKQGPVVLKPVIELNKEPGDETGWDRLQRTVDKYLRVAKNMIDDCISKTGSEDFTEAGDDRKGKKTDSGVSFGQMSSTSSANLEKPLPAMPPSEPEHKPEPKPEAKGLSKLERIAREFKRMRVKTRPDVVEIVKVDTRNAAKNMLPTPTTDQGIAKKSLKKARSLANLTHLRSANASSASLTSTRKGSDTAPFDAEEMRHQRMMYEALTTTTMKGPRSPM
jgi:hypothetical protein